MRVLVWQSKGFKGKFLKYALVRTSSQGWVGIVHCSLLRFVVWKRNGEWQSAIPEIKSDYCLLSRIILIDFCL